MPIRAWSGEGQYENPDKQNIQENFWDQFEEQTKKSKRFVGTEADSLRKTNRYTVRGV